MSTREVSDKAKETLKSVKAMLQKAEETVHKEMVKTAPKVARSLDESLDIAAKGFQNVMKTIDSRTENEQVGLLSAYRKFLSGQTAYVESRLNELHKEKAKEGSAK